MRLGHERGSRSELEACWRQRLSGHATKNTLTLLDSYKNFVTFETDNTILKLHKKEAELLRPYFEAEMKRAIATYEKKYRFKLDRPVQVEVYPDHEDFAVRTMGMPGLGALGVTFGYVIAMDSPSGRPPGDFHWACTLWHEMSHVLLLSDDQPSRAALVHRRHRGTRRDRRLAGMGRPARSRCHRRPSRSRSCCPSPSSTAASSIPRIRRRSWCRISRRAASAITSPTSGARPRSSP